MKIPKETSTNPAYEPADELWQKHMALFDETVMKGKNSNGIFVDGGCGQERFVERYADYFRHCIGMDVNIEKRHVSKGNVHFIKSNLEHIPLKSACTDILLTNFVLEHLSEPRKVFKEISRVLKDDGLFISWTPNANSPAGVIIRLLPYSMVKSLKKGLASGDSSYPTYYRANTPSTLDSLLEDAGFRRIRIEMIDGVFYLSRFQLIRWFHRVFIKLTNHGKLYNFKDIIFTVYTKSE
jgi:ubiquinone/menaquinone biosynthesis C-methylase UbiE